MHYDDLENKEKDELNYRRINQICFCDTWGSKQKELPGHGHTTEVGNARNLLREQYGGMGKRNEQHTVYFWSFLREV